MSCLWQKHQRPTSCWKLLPVFWYSRYTDFYKSRNCFNIAWKAKHTSFRTSPKQAMFFEKHYGKDIVCYAQVFVLMLNPYSWLILMKYFIRGHCSKDVCKTSDFIDHALIIPHWSFFPIKFCLITKIMDLHQYPCQYTCTGALPAVRLLCSQDILLKKKAFEV